MAAKQVRIEDDVYDMAKEKADKNRRSVQAQINADLEALYHGEVEEAL